MRSLCLTLYALTAFYALPTQGFATGQMICSVDDKNIDFQFAGNYSFGMRGGPSFQNGTLEIHNANAPVKLQHIVLAKDDLVERWFADGELNLLFTRYSGENYSDEAGGGWIELLIKTRRGSDGSFSGPYELTLNRFDKGQTDTTIIKGEAGCGGDES